MKVKKIILPIFLSFIFAVSSLTLFGCSKKTTPTSTYNLLHETITQMQEDNVVFEGGKLFDTDTNYLLKYIDSSKTDSFNTTAPDYSHYKVLVCYGLNFIEDYYPTLKSSTTKYKFKNLNKSITAMKNSYLSLKDEANNLAGAPSDVNNVVYNGFFYHYRNRVVDFVNNIYDCANELGNFLNSKEKLASEVGTDNMSPKELSFYIDYQGLRIFDDFRIFFNSSCKGFSLNNSFFKSVVKSSKNLLNSITKVHDNYIAKFESQLTILGSKQEEVPVLEEELKALRISLEETVKELKQVSEDKVSKEAEKTSLQDQLDAKREQLANANEENREQIQAEVDELTEKVAIAEAELTEITNNYQAKTDLKTEQENNITSKEEAIENKKKECQDFRKTTYDNVLSSNFRNLMIVFDKYLVSSDNVRKAMDGSSYYDYIKTYDSDINAYSKDKENGKIFINKIEQHFYEYGLVNVVVVGVLNNIANTRI